MADTTAHQEEKPGVTVLAFDQAGVSGDTALAAPAPGQSQDDLKDEERLTSVPNPETTDGDDVVDDGAPPELEHAPIGPEEETATPAVLTKEPAGLDLEKPPQAELAPVSEPATPPVQLPETQDSGDTDKNKPTMVLEAPLPEPLGKQYVIPVGLTLAVTEDKNNQSEQAVDDSVLEPSTDPVLETVVKADLMPQDSTPSVSTPADPKDAAGSQDQLLAKKTVRFAPDPTKPASGLTSVREQQDPESATITLDQAYRQSFPKLSDSEPWVLVEQDPLEESSEPKDPEPKNPKPEDPVSSGSETNGAKETQDPPAADAFECPVLDLDTLSPDHSLMKESCVTAVAYAMYQLSKEKPVPGLEALPIFESAFISRQAMTPWGSDRYRINQAPEQYGKLGLPIREIINCLKAVCAITSGFKVLTELSYAQIEDQMTKGKLYRRNGKKIPKEYVMRQFIIFAVELYDRAQEMSTLPIGEDTPTSWYKQDGHIQSYAAAFLHTILCNARDAIDIIPEQAKRKSLKITGTRFNQSNIQAWEIFSKCAVKLNHEASITLNVFNCIYQTLENPAMKQALTLPISWWSRWRIGRICRANPEAHKINWVDHLDGIDWLDLTKVLSDNLEVTDKAISYLLLESEEETKQRHNDKVPESDVSQIKDKMSDMITSKVPFEGLRVPQQFLKAAQLSKGVKNILSIFDSVADYSELASSFILAQLNTSDLSLQDHRELALHHLVCMRRWMVQTENGIRVVASIVHDNHPKSNWDFMTKYYRFFGIFSLVVFFHYYYKHTVLAQLTPPMVLDFCTETIINSTESVINMTNSATSYAKPVGAWVGFGAMLLFNHTMTLAMPALGLASNNTALNATIV